MKSYLAKPGQMRPQWWCVDADGQVLGRLAQRLATILMGKHKVEYTPHVDVGDYVIVVNAEKVRVTGRKAETKFYDYYTRYPGGYKKIPYQVMLAKHPERIIELAVRRMLPKTRLGRRMFRKLKVYAGPEHPHAAQQPKVLQL